MEKIDLLFILTFVFGVIALLTTTRISDGTLQQPIDLIFGVEDWKETAFKRFLEWIDRLIFYFCLCYQTWFWVWYLQ